ncbi:MAG: hypothetical protein R3277_01350 [Brumimicrobium sp.]|nr:hypothetical protein [Brumimicrobium sp.]
MRYVILILISFLFLGTSSCTKVGRNITVKGKVINPITGTRYPDLKVQLVKSQSLSLPGGFKEIKHTFTDENGEFELNATRLGKIWVQVQSGSDLYVIGWYQDGEYISDNFRTTAQKRKTMEADFHVVPYGEMILHIKNQNCQGPNDTLELYLDGSFITYTNQQGLLTTLTGCADAMGNPQKFPMGERYYHWVVKRDGFPDEIVYDTVFVQPNQETILEVFY